MGDPKEDFFGTIHGDSDDFTNHSRLYIMIDIEIEMR